MYPSRTLRIPFSVIREMLNEALHGMPRYRQKQNPGTVSCNTMFSNTERCNWHVELAKQCRQRRRRLTKKATVNLRQKTNRDDDCDSKEFLEEVDVKEMADSVDEDSRIEVNDKLTKTQPLRIKIKLVTTNVNPVKQETTFGKDETPERGDFKLSGVWVTFSCGYIFLNAPM